MQWWNNLEMYADVAMTGFATDRALPIPCQEWQDRVDSSHTKC